MREPFTTTEITTAIQSLKNNKTPGIDGLKAEQLKHSPSIVHEMIAEIFNNISETGNKPNELTTGILIPLQKPGKTQGPYSNLRRIILLSVLRKILSICLINRIGERIRKHIPDSQAAYQPGRSTTEHVFAYKLLAEKAITSNNYASNIILMGMSKAFDKVDRRKLLDDLRNILENDELHLIKMLINDMELSVKCGNTIGERFQTNQGVPQGDCSSPIMFILYLAKSMDHNSHLLDHTYSKPKHLSTPEPSFLKEHDYYMNKEKIYQISKQTLKINTEYADDVGKNIISQSCNTENNTKKLTDHYKLHLPDKLRNHNLQCNPEKTEHYTINRNGCDNWKKCIYLGSLLDTTNDIKRRKQLTMSAMLKLNYLWQSNKATITTKLRIFSALSKAFLCTMQSYGLLQQKPKRKKNSFHRKLLRKLLNIKWPKQITNEDLYSKTKEKPWSNIIAEQRIRWLGNALRLPENTPAKMALTESIRHVERPRGRPQTTWLQSVKKQLSEINITWEKASLLAQDPQQWRNVVKEFIKT